MDTFANYENGVITINTYRLANATVAYIDDILYAVKVQSDEILTASIDSEEEIIAIEDAK